jgi:hypothetical protein
MSFAASTTLAAPSIDRGEDVIAPRTSDAELVISVLCSFM